MELLPREKDKLLLFTAALVAERRKAPKEDLLSELIRAEEQGARLTEDELVTTAILLLNAGHEATVHTTGNGIKAILESSLPVETLFADPAQTEATVEECLRFDAPLHMFTRWAYEDIEVMGQTFRRGDQVGLLLAAANRDPGQWDQPAKFKPSRPVKPVATFGAGLHFCVGAPLARLELVTALPILFARLPGLKLAGKPFT